MFVVRHRRFFLIFTGLLLVASIVAAVVIPPALSIEFTGGSLMEARYDSGRPELSVVRERLSAIDLGEPSIRESGEDAITIRTHTLSPEERTQVLSALSANGAESVTELRFNSIGPSLGNELAIKALYAIVAVTIAIMLYIAWAFRGVSRPVPSWGYGIIAVFMLAIDIIVPTGFYAVYAWFTGAQFDSLFVIALLALLGYCVNDVIVIFDRVREHLKNNAEDEIEEDFEITVGKSIDETMGRSINTGLTVVLALLALTVIGSEATRNFALVMMVGVAAGTFSSITRSAPLLIPIASWLEKKRALKEKEV
ncbi:MAG TPA: protein translocase subunit SecF [Candidatus Paceibacterota bacterium]|nr:protein translocase subunit SecF [Candidatus Paceibacterota bacterium]